jgi:O-antigen/teichoic acid export membrane protein
VAKLTQNQLSNLNNEQFFCNKHLKNDLKKLSVRGGVVTITAQAIKFVLRMGSTVVLARLLSPEDYGLLGMATVIIGFVELFKDLGLSAATVQKAEINHQQVSTLFWINLVVSWIIALIVVGLAPVVAWFYHEPRLSGITLALAINFVFGGLTVQHQALLQRQMRFTSLAQIDIVSMSVGVIAAIVSAWYGLGYWALVVMQIATVITNAIAVWLICSWRPGFASKDSAIRSMLAFGGNLTGFRLVNYFSRNLDNLLIGRYWGSQQLGLYAKAYQLVLLPMEQINSPVNSVALPTLSSLQSEPEKYRKYYYKAILLITTLGMPIVGFMFASADKVILLMLGEQWLGVVPIFQFLMPAAFIGTFNVATGWVYQSLGRTDRQFRIGIVTATTDILLFSFSLPWGAVGVAAAYGLSRPILMVITIVYCYIGTPLKVTDFFQTIFRPTIASISAAIALIGVNYFLLANINLLIALSIDLLLYFCFYLSLWIFIPGGKSEMREILHILKTLKPKRK